MIARFILVLLIFNATYASANAEYFGTFWYPQYHGEPLAWCTEGKIQQCGRVPAERYCKAMGYEGVFTFHPDKVLSKRSIDPASRCLCRSGYCQSYQVIKCKKQFQTVEVG